MKINNSGSSNNYTSTEDNASSTNTVAPSDHSKIPYQAEKGNSSINVNVPPDDPIFTLTTTDGKVISRPLSQFAIWKDFYEVLRSSLNFQESTTHCMDIPLSFQTFSIIENFLNNSFKTETRPLALSKLKDELIINLSNESIEKNDFIKDLEHDSLSHFDLNSVQTTDKSLATAISIIGQIDSFANKFNLPELREASIKLLNDKIILERFNQNSVNYLMFVVESSDSLEERFLKEDKTLSKYDKTLSKYAWLGLFTRYKNDAETFTAILRVFTEKEGLDALVFRFVDFFPADFAAQCLKTLLSDKNPDSYDERFDFSLSLLKAYFPRYFHRSNPDSKKALNHFLFNNMLLTLADNVQTSNQAGKIFQLFIDLSPKTEEQPAQFSKEKSLQFSDKEHQFMKRKWLIVAEILDYPQSALLSIVFQKIIKKILTTDNSQEIEPIFSQCFGCFCHFEGGKETSILKIMENILRLNFHETASEQLQYIRLMLAIGKSLKEFHRVEEDIINYISLKEIHTQDIPEEEVDSTLKHYGESVYMALRPQFKLAPASSFLRAISHTPLTPAPSTSFDFEEIIELIENKRTHVALIKLREKFKDSKKINHSIENYPFVSQFCKQFGIERAFKFSKMLSFKEKNEWHKNIADYLMDPTMNPELNNSAFDLDKTLKFIKKLEKHDAKFYLIFLYSFINKNIKENNSAIVEAWLPKIDELLESTKDLKGRDPKKYISNFLEWIKSSENNNNHYLTNILLNKLNNYLKDNIDEIKFTIFKNYFNCLFKISDSEAIEKLKVLIKLLRSKTEVGFKQSISPFIFAMSLKFGMVLEKFYKNPVILEQISLTIKLLTLPLTYELFTIVLNISTGLLNQVNSDPSILSSNPRLQPLLPNLKSLLIKKIYEFGIALPIKERNSLFRKTNILTEDKNNEIRTLKLSLMQYLSIGKPDPEKDPEAFHKKAELKSFLMTSFSPLLVSKLARKLSSKPSGIKEFKELKEILPERSCIEFMRSFTVLKSATDLLNIFSEIPFTLCESLILSIDSDIGRIFNQNKESQEISDFQPNDTEMSDKGAKRAREEEISEEKGEKEEQTEQNKRTKIETVSRDKGKEKIKDDEKEKGID